MKTLKDLKKIKNKKALVRVDYNVPFKNGKILDTRRIDSSFETIKSLHKKGFQVLLLAHLGDNKATLKPVAKYLSKYFKIVFITEDIKNTEKIKSLCSQVSQDTIILFENIRFYVEEEKNDAKFAKGVSKLGDVFVNDAFSVSHRNHASVVGIAKYLPSYAGVQLESEIKNLKVALESKKHPSLFILGGAKFGTKIPLLKKFIDISDNIVITGAILNSFYKSIGFEIGDSVVEDGYEKEIKKLTSSPKILLPVDVIVVRSGVKKLVMANEVQKGDIIVDVGKQSIELIDQKIKKSKIILWNGPTGWYEKGFVTATKSLAQSIKSSKAFSVVGGGDTGAVVEKILGGSKKTKNIFVSTGGGATLEYLASGTLVGVKYLKD
jgi:3-phosphoglycerate kinase